MDLSTEQFWDYRYIFCCSMKLVLIFENCLSLVTVFNIDWILYTCLVSTRLVIKLFRYLLKLQALYLHYTPYCKIPICWMFNKKRKSWGSNVFYRTSKIHIYNSSTNPLSTLFTKIFTRNLWSKRKIEKEKSIQSISQLHD